MSAEPKITDLLSELKSARQAFSARNQKVVDRAHELERSLNEVHVGMRRPGDDGPSADDRDIERKSAREMCIDRHSWAHQKHEGQWTEYMPHSAEFDEALCAHRAFKSHLRNGGDYRRLDPLQQKSLTAFSFGNSGWALPQEVSSRVLSCLTGSTDFLSLLAQEQAAAERAHA